jgi:hypothetical protein
MILTFCLRGASKVLSSATKSFIGGCHGNSKEKGSKEKSSRKKEKTSKKSKLQQKSYQKKITL